MSKRRERIRELWEDRRYEFLLAAVALLAALLGFLLGTIIAREAPAPIVIETCEP